MAVVFAPRTIEIAVIQTQMGRPVVNVWHMQTSTELWPASATDVVEDFRNNWQDHMTELSTSHLELVEFQWRSLDPGDGSLGIVPLDPGKPVAGKRSGEAASPAVAKLVKKNTPNRPRGARDGRSFIAGVPEGDVDPGGNIAPAMIPVDNGFLADFYNGISDSGVFTNDERWPVVLETTEASRAPGTQSVTIDVRRLSSVTLDLRAATQRERQR